ncbi:MAG: DivIVA domain-containing protein [Calditrichaeota bacterium]|nr:DivIVA domain-containing protein [Calditrichota bacterium]
MILQLTPLDIRKKEFKKVMRGCDPAEVEAFLELLSEEFELLQMEIDRQKKENELLSEKNQSLSSQQKQNPEPNQADRLSQKEAEIIIKEAEVKALEIVEKAKSEANRLKEEIFVLKSQKNSFIKRLKHLFASQIELIDVLEIEDIDVSEYKTLSQQIDKPKVSDKPSHISGAGKKKEQVDILLDDIEEKTESLRKSVNIDDDLPFIKKKARELLDEEKKDEENKEDQEGDSTFDHFIKQIGDGDEN